MQQKCVWSIHCTICLTGRQIFSFPPDKNANIHFIGENQITVDIKQFWLTTNAHIAPPNDFLFPLLWTTSPFPLNTLSFRYGLYFQEMYAASCMVGSSNLIDRHYVPSQSTARNSSLRRWVILSYNRGWIKGRLIAYLLAVKPAQICTANVYNQLTGIYNWTKWISVLISPIIKIKRREFNHLKEYTANDQFTLP